jgi:hypothetical protein
VCSVTISQAQMIAYSFCGAITVLPVLEVVPVQHLMEFG